MYLDFQNILKSIKIKIKTNVFINIALKVVNHNADMAEIKR